MASKAPIEIWIKIFEETIDVPEFFSADPLVSFGLQSWVKFRHEEYYWRSERWRNNLRRVHSSWNAILCQPVYRHRFVLMSDVTHGQISPEDIPWPTMRRISFGPAEGCECAKLCIGWRPFTQLEPAGNKAAIAVLERAAARCGEERWRLSVVDGIYLLNADRFRAIFKRSPIQAILTPNDYCSFEDHHEDLRQMHLMIDYRRPRDLQPSSFPRLTTLVIQCPMRRLSLDSWHLPALQYLQLSGPFTLSHIQHTQDTMRILERIGSNLRMLHVDDSYHYFPLPSQFWSFVPKLTHIRLACLGICAPPEDHPLAVATVDLGTVLWMYNPKTRHHLPGWTITPELAQDASVEEVMGGAGWARRHLQVAIRGLWERIFYRSNYFERCLHLANLYAGIGWTLIDYTGMTINDFIVLLLERRREGRKLEEFWSGPEAHHRPIERRSHALPASKRMGETDRDLLAASLFAIEVF